MLIRVLVIGGLLSAACQADAQSYFDSYGYNASPLYETGQNHWYGGIAHSPVYYHYNLDCYRPAQKIYGYGETTPLSCSRFDCQGMANRNCYQTDDVIGCGRPYGCPLDGRIPYDGRAFDGGGFGEFPQPDSDPSGHGHAGDGHDHGHTHAQPPAALTPRADAGPLGVIPNTGRWTPPAQTPIPIDRDRLAPPSLPRRSQPGQTESPLGDGPPPPTVPLSSPRRLQRPESKSLNI